MGKLIEYVLARRGIIVIISSLMQMITEIRKISEINEKELSDIYKQFKRYIYPRIEVGIKVNVAQRNN